MALKDIRKYYEQVCAQYKEMIENIKDLEKEAAEGLVEPERIDRLAEQIAPLKNNYERWTYMMFLLNQPARKSKVPKYRKMISKKMKELSVSNSIESTIAENNDVLNHIGE